MSRAIEKISIEVLEVRSTLPLTRVCELELGRIANLVGSRTNCRDADRGGSVQAQAPPRRTECFIAYYSVTGNTEKMAQGVAERAKTASGTNVVLKRVGEVTADDLLSSDAVIAGSTVYFVHTAGGVKTFFDNWFLKFDFFRELKCEIKLVVRFNRWMISNGKEITMMAILEAMLISKMIITSAGGHSASAQAQQPDRTRPALTKGNLYCCC